HLQCRRAMGFDPSDSIALEQPEGGPRIGVELPLAVSSSGPRLVEMPGAFVAHRVQAYEIERAQSDVVKILPAHRLAEREQRDGRFGVPGRQLFAIHRGWLSAPPLTW